MRTTWSFYSAGQLTFGSGAVAAIGRESKRRGFQRVLLVTDAILSEAGVVQKVVAPLKDAGVEVTVFDGGEAEPSLAAADNAIEQARKTEPQAIIGLGGGSNMDLAKITAVSYTHGGQPSDYFSFDNVPGPVVPLVCVPTTAGTGSEVSHAAVLTDTENEMKVSTLSQHLRPALAIVDPELTFSCPAKVTADSGIDALTHAIEGYTARDYNALPFPPGEPCAYEGRHPLGDCLAEKAIALIRGTSGERRQRWSKPRSARGHGLGRHLGWPGVFQLRRGARTRARVSLGGALHCSHGAGNGLLLPFVMRFNLPEREQAFGRIAELFGRDTRELDERQAAEEAIAAVEQLKRDIGIPERIRDLGGSDEQLPGFAEKAFGIKRLMEVNPRAPSLDDLTGILRDAF